MSDKIDEGLNYLRDRSDKLDEVANDFAEEFNDLYEEIDHLKDTLRTIYTWNASGDYQRDLFRMKDFAGAALKVENEQDH